MRLRITFSLLLVTSLVPAQAEVFPKSPAPRNEDPRFFDIRRADRSKDITPVRSMTSPFGT
jgi:hypothetical protein